jgi:prophage endopeptidase
MKLLPLVPASWKIGAVLLLVAALVAVDAWRVQEADQVGFDRATTERAARDSIAVFTRVKENVAVGIKQDAINAFITKAKNEEIFPVVQRIYIDRVRVGPGTCGPAAGSKAEDAGGGDGADSSGRLVREDVERDTRALTEAVEQDLATGRACQAWGKENGFMP